MNPRLPWMLSTILALALVGLSVVGQRRAVQQHTTYVFTPLVDVAPPGSPLSDDEAGRLLQSLRSQVDARDMQQAYATLGSTLSLDDLLRGIESLDEAGLPLEAGQRQRVAAILEGSRAEHAEILQVQRDILGAEKELSDGVDGVLATLPEPTRARVQGRLR